jgi:Helix-turn-helix domain
MNATPTAARPQSKPADRPAPHVRIPVNLDVSRIKPSHLKMLLILEAFWADKSYCWPSNETLAKKFGCSVSRARQILYEMEDLGYIYLLPADPTKPHGERAGIFAHRRLNPDRPVEDRPPPPEAIDRLWAARARSLGAGVPPCRNSDNPPCRDPAKPLVGIPTPSKEYSLSLNQTHSEPGVALLDQRQRKDPPEPEPLPAVLALETTAAVHPPINSAPIAAADVPELPAEPSQAAAEPTAPAGAVEALTAGQIAFLESLSPEQRAGFDAASPGKRAALLKPHEKGFDPHIRAFQERSGELPAAAPPAPPAIPATLEELIEQLPGSPRDWPQQTAQAMAMTFGRRKDEQLWGEFNKIAELVAAGRIDPGAVLNAYRQAMAPGIKKPGAKFWAALKGLTGLDEGDLKAMIAGGEPCPVR